MSLETNLRGRLRNTKLPLRHGLLPLFEAVVNSMHSIEDANLPIEQGKIVIDILRSEQQPMQGLEFDPNAIVGFKIWDNGVGFDDSNMGSFKTLDSEHKIDRGGRGVGRLLWLKAFRRVEVKSIFYDDSQDSKVRSFKFDGMVGVYDSIINNSPKHIQRHTTITLDDFVKRYQEATYKTASSIANSLLEHCLWYFVRSDGAPNIFVNDNEISINLTHLYQQSGQFLT